jgi:hypothetical protein
MALAHTTNPSTSHEASRDAGLMANAPIHSYALKYRRRLTWLLAQEAPL